MITLSSSTHTSKLSLPKAAEKLGEISLQKGQHMEVDLREDAIHLYPMNTGTGKRSGLVYCKIHRTGNTLKIRMGMAAIVPIVLGISMAAYILVYLSMIRPNGSNSAIMLVGLVFLAIGPIMIYILWRKFAARLLQLIKNRLEVDAANPFEVK